MDNLCYATFLHLIQKYYVNNIEAENLAKDILIEILPESEYKKFEGKSGKKYLSALWTRTRNIPKQITDALSISSYKKACLDHFNNVIVKDINPASEDDFYFNVANLISNDDSISQKKKNSLHKIIETGDKGKYLFEVFIYAVTKENKNGRESLEKDTIQLLADVDQICPLCHKSLIESKKNKTIYRYSITRIYPEFLDSNLKDEFDAIKPKPDKPDDSMNKLCLCDNCSNDYIYSPNSATYERLLRLKHQSIFNLNSKISNFPLEDQIVFILKCLSNTNPEDGLLDNFRMKPLEPCNKIKKENYLLTKAIKDDNDVFYWFIKEHISQMDEVKSSFRTIASEVKSAFLKLNQEEYDQFEIFKQLTDWIMKEHLLPASYYQAAHIIVSYFVQSCEVFDEISK